MEPRFLLDGMLGRLARWLRILGYDTAYQHSLADNDLLRIASKESRILVTRDRDLHRRAVMNNLNSHFLENKRLEDWLLSLASRYDLIMDLQKVAPRCSVCNTLLDTARKDTILKMVPARIQERTTEFWRCPSCGKTYWQGTHWERMSSFLESINKKKEA